MPSYGFCLRASTRKGGGVGRLYLRIVHGCESRSVTTDYRILPEEWDAAGRRLLIPYGRGVRSRQLVEMESAMMCDLRRMDAVVREMERGGGGFTVDELMGRYRSVMHSGTLAAFTEKLAVDLECDGHHRTAKAYRTAASRLQKFNGGKDVYAERLTTVFIGEFQQALKAEGRSMNTISFYMRTLRAIYNKAVSGGYAHRHGENPFAGVYTGVSTTRKLALTHAELATLTAFDPTGTANRTKQERLPEPLGRSLAMFLFCCHARGMCYVDMANLKKADLRGDTIRYRRQKTGQVIVLKVLPAMRRIIEWFGPQTVGSKYLFPVITDCGKDEMLQYESGLRLQNIRLKKIAALCGISKQLSTHCARHSWATMAKNAGLPLAVISEGLGHTNQRTTEIYLASLERSVIDRASMIVSDAIEGDGYSRKQGRKTGSGAGGLPAKYGVYGGGFEYSALFR